MDQENNANPKLCTHGLNDRCILSTKVVVTDFKMGVVTSSYVFYCPDHETYGKHTVKTQVDPTPAQRFHPGV